jgi:predicted ABC-type ATPase
VPRLVLVAATWCRAPTIAYQARARDRVVICEAAAKSIRWSAGHHPTYREFAFRIDPTVAVLKSIRLSQLAHPLASLFLPAGQTAAFVSSRLATLTPADTGQAPILLYPFGTRYVIGAIPDFSPATGRSTSVPRGTHARAPSSSSIPTTCSPLDKACSGLEPACRVAGRRDQRKHEHGAAVNSVHRRRCSGEGTIRERKMDKRILILAGPNGAGKTTFAREFLVQDARCPAFVNADLIAAGLSPFDPSRVALRAGRLMLELMVEHVARGESFAFETTLAGRNFARAIAGWRSADYHVSLIFLSLPSADLAVHRVAQRIRQGGHAVPEADVRRRFDRGRAVRDVVQAHRRRVDAI